MRSIYFCYLRIDYATQVPVLGFSNLRVNISLLKVYTNGYYEEILLVTFVTDIVFGTINTDLTS